MRELCIQKFIAQAKAYVEMKTLMLELLRVFIRAFRLPEQDGFPVLESLVPKKMKETA